MKILVIGASGLTGRHVTQMAVSRSHTVTVLVRSKGAIAEGDVRVIVRDLTNPADVEQAIHNQDVVISYLGQRSKKDALLLQTAASATMQAMSSSTACRYIVISQGLLFPSRSPVVALLWLILARYVVDSTAMEELLKDSKLAWTIIRPPRLLEGGVPHGYCAKSGSLPAGPGAMQRIDLAAYLLDEAERSEHVRTIVGVRSRRSPIIRLHADPM